jgi:hypothetical protein
MTNTAHIYVLLFGQHQSRLPPPDHDTIMELAYIFAGAGTLSTRDKHPTWLACDTHSTNLPLSLHFFASTSLIDPSRPGRMVRWCPLAQTRDTIEPGAALDDTGALASLTTLHYLAKQTDLSNLDVLPDHVVQTALQNALQVMGAYGPDVNLACIWSIGSICDVAEVTNVDFTHARQTRLNLQQLGLALPGLLIGGSPLRNECPTRLKCGDWVSLLVLVFYIEYMCLLADT